MRRRRPAELTCRQDAGAAGSIASNPQRIPARPTSSPHAEEGPNAVRVVQWAGTGDWGGVGACPIDGPFPGDPPQSVALVPRPAAWQASSNTSKNPEAIIFYMAFPSLFADPEQARAATFPLMIGTFADAPAVRAVTRRLLPRLTAQRLLERGADAPPTGRASGSLRP